jgi:hypothetical protein
VYKDKNKQNNLPWLVKRTPLSLVDDGKLKQRKGMLVVVD